MSVQKVLTNLADRIRFYTKQEYALSLEQMSEEIDLVYGEGIEWAVIEVNNALFSNQLPTISSSNIGEELYDALEHLHTRAFKEGTQYAVRNWPKAEKNGF